MVWNQGYLSLAVVLLFLGMAVQPAVAGPNLDDFPDKTDARDGRELAAPFRELAGLVAALKADTTDPTDSDSDGLPDSVEWVIGTDPLNNDTDFDQINDSREIELQLDPNEIDSNRDGLADYFETGNVSLDLDGDGVGNAWDWDNDNDGVVDSIDLSPFARTDTYSNLSLSINSSGKPTYVDLQLRTKNPDNMRLIDQAWNWPADDKGQMQDLDNSGEDVIVTPMLVFETNTALDMVQVADYGMFVDGQTAYLPLVPVSDYGNIVAFNARMFIPDLGGPALVSGNLSLSWMVTGYSDSIVYGLKADNGDYVSVNQTGVVRANASELTESEGLEIVDTGTGSVTLKAANGNCLGVGSDYAISASSDVEGYTIILKEDVGNNKIILKKNERNYVTVHVSDNALYLDATEKANATVFTLTDPWIQPSAVTLAVYPEDFMLTGLSVQENFGSDFGAFYGGDVANLTAANLLIAYDFLRNGTNRVADMPGLLAGYNVSVQSKRASFAHRDLAVVATMGKGLRDMIGTLPDHKILPIINIMEDRSTVVELSELGGASHIKGRSLSANLVAQPVVTSKTLKTNWYDTDNDTCVEIGRMLQELNEHGLSEESFALLAVLYLAWNTGEHTVSSIDGQPVDFMVPDVEKIPDIAFNVVSKGLTGIEMALKVAKRFEKYQLGLQWVKKLERWNKYMDMDLDYLAFGERFLQADNVNLAKVVKTGTLKWATKVSKVLKYVGIIADIGVAIFTIVVMIKESGGTAAGTGTAIVTAAINLAYGLMVGYVAGVLCACGPAGWVLAGVFLLLVILSESVRSLPHGKSWAELVVQ